MAERTIISIKMDQETANYIVTYFFNLLSNEEKIAWKHHSSILKLEENNNPEKLEIYKRKGWVTDQSEILNLLKDGYENFELNAATKILQNFPEKVFLNNCPNCSKLARTPLAKQCRFCGFNWHK